MDEKNKTQWIWRDFTEFTNTDSESTGFRWIIVIFFSARRGLKYSAFKSHKTGDKICKRKSYNKRYEGACRLMRLIVEITTYSSSSVRRMDQKNFSHSIYFPEWKIETKNDSQKWQLLLYICSVDKTVTLSSDEEIKYWDCTESYIFLNDKSNRFRIYRSIHEIESLGTIRYSILQKKYLSEICRTTLFSDSAWRACTKRICLTTD